MSKSLKENYIYSLINTLSSILFPLIAFPYASRILEADGIGHVGFFTSIITYISLFTCLGIPIYAIRETAKVRDDQVELSRTTIEILLLHTSMVIIGYIVVAILCFTVDKISVDIPLFLILSVSILFTAIGCEWFYQGIEDFKYIAIRGLVVRFVYLILLFLFVQKKSDLLIYAGLSVFGTVGNNAFNFIKLWQYVKIRVVFLKTLRIRRHIFPALKIFTLNLVTSLYVNLDTVMLGFLKDSYAVGYYDAASKIAKLLLSLIQSLQAAMIPRFSYLVKEGKLTEFHELSQKVVDYVVTISIPMTIGLVVLAPSLISVFCGATFTPAIITLQIISPIVLMISLSGIAGLQILYPLGKETLVIWATATGAIVNLILCILLIPFFAENGAAVAVLFGETAVTVSMFIYGRKYIKIKKMSKHYVNCIMGGIILLIVFLFINNLGLNSLINILCVSIIGPLVYGLYLYWVKDDFGLYLLRTFKSRIRI